MNKKVIIGVIVAIIIVALAAFMLMPNEDAIYNEKMSVVYNDLIQSESILNQSYSTQTELTDSQIDEFITQADNLTAIYDKDILELKDLNKSINNATRKEYIGLSVQELELMKKALVDVKNGVSVVKDMNSNKINPFEALSKTATVEEELNKTFTESDAVYQQLKEYESKYPFVLINGTTSFISNETLNATKA